MKSRRPVTFGVYDGHKTALLLCSQPLRQEPDCAGQHPVPVCVLPPRGVPDHHQRHGQKGERSHPTLCVTSSLTVVHTYYPEMIGEGRLSSGVQSRLEQLWIKASAKCPKWKWKCKRLFMVGRTVNPPAQLCTTLHPLA